MMRNDVRKGEFTFHSIGVIRSPHTDPEKTPIQPVYADGARGNIEIFPGYADGLRDLDGFSHLHIIYVFHRSEPSELIVKPYLDDHERGIFSTRSPRRPNAIGMSLVRLLGIEGSTLRIEDVDVLDGTPLLDIKPYVARFDLRENVRSGWQDRVTEEEAVRRGRRWDSSGSR